MTKLAKTQTDKKTLVFDLDGCLCSQTKGDYKNSKPILRAIKTVNYLYKNGHTIIIFTSRFMGRNNGNVKKTYKDGFQFTKNQLKKWNVKYHQLIMGKPRADIVIDDRSLFFNPNWKLIKKEIERKLKLT